MHYAKTYSVQLDGLCSSIVTIETDIVNGLHSFSLVGLGDKTLTEAKDRVSSAIRNTGFISPKQKNQKVVVSLAPAHTKKVGTQFDLAIALSYLLASGSINFDPHKKIFIGELSLEGKVRSIKGILSLTSNITSSTCNEVYIPSSQRDGIPILKNVSVFPVTSLDELIRHLSGSKKIPPLDQTKHVDTDYEQKLQPSEAFIDMSSIKGNAHAKRALEISAVGKHNVIMSGPPGAGKTMLARAYIDILPELSEEKSIEVSAIYSSDSEHTVRMVKPPFRSPHHTSSVSAIIGGGGMLKYGEITRAHHGVLFLDELPEFSRECIESLRQPLEEKVIRISRAHGSVTYPCDFVLIGAMNPCPCGIEKGRCTCTEREKRLYNKKLSHAIIDRIDIFVDIHGLTETELSYENIHEPSARIAKRVADATTFLNAHPKKVLSTDAKLFLKSNITRYHLSARSYERTIRVAKSIACLCSNPVIQKEHLLEALSYKYKKGETN